MVASEHRLRVLEIGSLIALLFLWFFCTAVYSVLEYVSKMGIFILSNINANSKIQ